MVTNGQEVSAFGEGGSGDDSIVFVMQMTTGFCIVSTKLMDSHS